MAAHHTFYAWGLEPWEYPLESVQTMCDPCHKEIHGLETKVYCTCAECHEKIEAYLMAGHNGLDEPFCEGCAMKMEQGRGLPV